MRVLVLDSLFDSLEIETDAAVDQGAMLERWDGSAAALGEADVVAHVQTRIDEEMISRLSKCRAITRFGTGLDTVDLAAAERAGIPVVGVRGYCTRELASHTLVLALTVVRRLDELRSDVRDGRLWQDVARTSPIASRRTATVIGLGAVGERVAAALVALGYEVSVVTHRAAEDAERIGASLVSLEQGLDSADILFLHTALEAEAQRLINVERLSLMRPGTILVNTARIGLLDEAAVAGAVMSGHLSGLALDARLDYDSPLRQVTDNPCVVVTPHVGWYSEESANLLRRRAISEGIAVASVTRDRGGPRA